MTNKQRIATHEAGHVIAAVQLGIPVVSATIEHGQPHFFRGGFRRTRDLAIEHLVIVCLAGGEAERLFFWPIVRCPTKRVKSWCPITAGRVVPSDTEAPNRRGAAPPGMLGIRGYVRPAATHLNNPARYRAGPDFDQCRQSVRVRNMICPSCGGVFRPTRGDARYCSGACRQDAHRLRKAG
jgi:hypothetical protein